MSAIPGSPTPAGSSPLPPPTREEIKKLAETGLSQIGMGVAGKVEEDKRTGSFVFTVGGQYNKRFTVSVGRNVLASLTTDEAKRDWMKALAVQISTGSGSFDLKNRSITISGQTHFFTYKEQVEAHKERYAKLADNLKAFERDINAAEAEVKKTKDHLADKNFHHNDPETIKELKTTLKTEQQRLIQTKHRQREAERQIDILDKLHLIAGQVFVEGGIAPDVDPNRTQAMRALPPLPPMPHQTGPEELAATISTSEPAPTTFKNPLNLPSPLAREEAPATVAGSVPIPINGRSLRVLKVVDQIKEGLFPSDADLSKLNLIRVEQWALLDEAREHRDNLIKQLSNLTPNEARRMGEIEEMITKTDLFLKQLDGLYKYWKPQF